MTDRIARCAYFSRCGRQVPSSTLGLAFFEDLSAGNTDHTCRHCSYAEIAHRRFSGELRDTASAGAWPRDVEPHAFEPLLEGREFDRYYCGCFGWD